MGRFIGLYLAITGIGALVVTAAPWLVIIGFFLLIIPGLILSLLPTAFLYGCVFAIAWWLARAVLADPFASIVAILVTALAVCAVTWPGHALGERRLAASVLPDVTPRERIRPAGDIRVERAWSRVDNLNPRLADAMRPASCDNLCVALLFTPGVTSVTMSTTAGLPVAGHREGASPLTLGAMTYRLAPRAECGDRAIKPDLVGRVGLYGKTLEENRAIDATWNLELASEWCIVRDAPLDRFDLLIREGRYDYPAKDDKPSFLLPSPARVSYVELRDGTGGVLLRQLVSRLDVLGQPLAFLSSGGTSNFGFRWARATLFRGSRHLDAELDKALIAHTTLADAKPAADLLPLIRQNLRRALGDAALTSDDPAFATLDAWFTGLAAAPLAPEDEVVTEALIADMRLTSYDGLYRLHDLPPAQHRRLRAAMVDRLLAAPDAASTERTGFGDFFRKAPAGSYATLTAAEERLLDDAERRTSAAGLVVRLADRGAVAVPRLVALLRHHGTALREIVASERKMEQTLRSRLLHANDRMVAAVRVALCRLGADARAALPEVEAMIAAGVVPPRALDGHGGTDWHLALARMGKPVASLRKPASLSGTDASHQRRVRDKLARFDPDRSCD